MKSKKIITAAAALLTISLLAGCSNNSREKALEDQVLQLEQQVTDLKNSQNTGKDDKTSAEGSATDKTSAADNTGDSDNTGNADNTGNGDDGTADNTRTADNGAGNAAGTVDGSANAPQDPKTVPSLEELSESVSAVSDKVNSTTPTGTSEEQLEQYRTLKREIDSIDRDLDYWDDDIESQFERGTLTREEYRETDRRIDTLEDQLDNAEDYLENLFGIDD